MMHELGHASGLVDLYYERYNSRYSHYLMGSYRTTSIQEVDVNYLREVHRNAEHRSGPH